MGNWGQGYSSLLRSCNRTRKRTNKITCECGKDIFETQIEKHKKTKMHEKLLKELEKYNEFKIKEEKKNKERIIEINVEIQELMNELNVISANN